MYFLANLDKLKLIIIEITYELSKILNSEMFCDGQVSVHIAPKILFLK